MRSPVSDKKADARAALESDVERFLAGGGEIESVGTNVYERQGPKSDAEYHRTENQRQFTIAQEKKRGAPANHDWRHTPVVEAEAKRQQQGKQ